MPEGLLPEDLPKGLLSGLGVCYVLIKGMSTLIPIGISLTPTDSFDSGFVVLDKKRQLLRMDKFMQDAPALQSILTLDADPTHKIVAIDLPKNIAMSAKFRFEKIRMHPLLGRSRLNQQTQLSASVDSSGMRAYKAFESRYADRLYAFLDALTASGVEPVVFSSAQVRQVWQIQPPFRSRSGSYCKALQLALKTHLGVANIPTQVPAATLLDATVAALVAWSLVYTPAADADSVYALEDSTDWPSLGIGELSAPVNYYRPLQGLKPLSKTRFKAHHVRY
jgi:hypothetical protein